MIKKDIIEDQLSSNAPVRCTKMKRRSSIWDRRSGTDRRKIYHFRGLFRGKAERRCGKERRSKFEARQGWVRVDKWSSVRLEGLKIAKYMR